MTHAVCEFDIAACVFQKKFGKNLTVVSQGRCCPEMEDCGSLVDPVCDSFGNTHQSACSFEVVKCQAEKAGESHLEIVANGPCEIESLKIPESSHNDVPETVCPNSCTAVYAPVCGSDGRTYPNMCYLTSIACNGQGNSKLKMAYEGECCKMECKMNWNPVCDSDGFTHMNLCQFGKSRCLAEKRLGKTLRIKSFGICDGSPCLKTCTEEYQPICGSDGPCCPATQCPYTYSPICDTEGVTHINKCVFHAAQCLALRRNSTEILVLYEAPCCNQPCTDDINPVCDGEKSHSNLCKFRIAQCQAQHQGQEISVEYKGQCCERKVCDAKSVVCDSEGQTHMDLCELELKQCLAHRLYGHNITVAHVGECCMNQVCPDVYEPVCDSQGEVHNSECDFNNAACVFEKVFNSTLSLEYAGECCHKDCGSSWDPVCDQHGKLYKNKCLFEIEACHSDRKAHKMLLMTPCSSRRTARLLRHRVL